MRSYAGDTHLLLDIPCDVLGEVFCNWLDIKSLCRIDSAVCSREERPRLLKILSSNHCILERNGQNGFSFIKGSVEWLTKRMVQLSRVDIEASSNELSKYLRLFSKSIRHVCCLNNEGIDLVAVSCRNLESFACMKLSVKPNLSAVLEFNTNLQELRLEAVQDLVVTHFDGICLPRLRLLSLKGTVCDDALLTSLVVTTEKLQHVQIGGCDHITDNGLIVLARHCQLLRSVGLRRLRMSDTALELLVQLCPCIENLDLRENIVLTDTGVFSVVSRLRGLRRVSLSSCTSLTDISLEHLVRFSAQSLQWLDIVEWPQVRVDVLVRLLKQCDQLHTLCLDCDIDSYCADIVPHLHNLQCFLSYCVMSDKCLCLIAQHCKQLRLLGIPCTFKVDRNLVPAVHQSSVEAGLRDVRVMHPTVLYVDSDEVVYTEKGLLALMDELPSLRMLVGSVVSDYADERAAVYLMVQTLWRRLRPGIQFTDWDSCLHFDVLHDCIPCSTVPRIKAN